MTIKKVLFTVVVLCCGCAFHQLSAQAVSGVWQGILMQGKGMRQRKMPIEMKLLKTGDTLVGTVYYFTNEKNYVRYAVKGYFGAEYSTVYWQDIALLENTMPSRENLVWFKEGLKGRADFSCPDGKTPILDGTAMLPGEEVMGVKMAKGDRPMFSDEWDEIIEEYYAGANRPELINSVWEASLVRAKEKARTADIAAVSPQKPVSQGTSPESNTVVGNSRRAGEGKSAAETTTNPAISSSSTSIYPNKQVVAGSGSGGGKKTQALDDKPVPQTSLTTGSAAYAKTPKPDSTAAANTGTSIAIGEGSTAMAIRSDSIPVSTPEVAKTKANGDNYPPEASATVNSKSNPTAEAGIGTGAKGTIGQTNTNTIASGNNIKPAIADAERTSATTSAGATGSTRAPIKTTEAGKTDPNTKSGGGTMVNVSDEKSGIGEHPTRVAGTTTADKAGSSTTTKPKATNTQTKPTSASTVAAAPSARPVPPSGPSKGSVSSVNTTAAGGDKATSGTIDRTESNGSPNKSSIAKTTDTINTTTSTASKQTIEKGNTSPGRQEADSITVLTGVTITGVAAKTVSEAGRLDKNPVGGIESPQAFIPAPEPKIAEAFTSRKKQLQTEMEVAGDSLELRFYDNAEVDGDSIALFLDGIMLFQHVRLEAKPYVFKIAVANLLAVSELTMVAENLGAIPPNTAFMEAFAGGQRFTARLVSTEESSGVIRLTKKE